MPLTQLSIIFTLTLTLSALGAGDSPTTLPADRDAAGLFDRAASLIRENSPGHTGLEWDYFQPPPQAWRDLAGRAWKANGPARMLVRQARSLKHGDWNAGDEESMNKRLNRLRRLATDLSDAAHFRHLEYDDAAAIELIRDVLHIAAVLRDNPPRDRRPIEALIRPLLVGVGIEALAMARLTEIIADIQIADDASKPNALRPADARALIKTLIDRQQEPPTLLREILGDAEFEMIDNHLGESSKSRMVEQLNRTNMEVTFAAMSLACHLYRLEHGNWPNAIDECVPAYLPRVPIDPWSDSKQPFGYALIKQGLSDGADRPLVYARCNSKDGLRYRIDGPFYSFYATDGSNRLQSEMIRGGQFRDVARWSPKETMPSDHRPHTRTLESEAPPGL
jgi:hypothetical protein